MSQTAGLLQGNTIPAVCFAAGRSGQITVSHPAVYNGDQTIPNHFYRYTNGINLLQQRDFGDDRGRTGQNDSGIGDIDAQQPTSYANVPMTHTGLSPQRHGRGA